MARKRRLTRAQRRERRAARPVAGLYGVMARDAGAGGWVGLYLCYAHSPEEARNREVAAGFHKRGVEARWTPGHPPPHQPPDVGPDDDHWYRSRLEDAGWTPWERLPSDYRHPPQGLATIDPSAR
ncbi:hypothetical protein [Streptomyces sp. NPDC005438]|uniref:hypothetical protein n=1 Tax=Streptomyces sp. NPDC005438 TaxID=3156880 RepID=UPI0033B836ED